MGCDCVSSQLPNLVDGCIDEVESTETGVRVVVLDWKEQRWNCWFENGRLISVKSPGDDLDRVDIADIGNGLWSYSFFSAWDSEGPAVLILESSSVTVRRVGS
jgi:hypothetical protein